MSRANATRQPFGGCDHSTRAAAAYFGISL